MRNRPSERYRLRGRGATTIILVLGGTAAIGPPAQARVEPSSEEAVFRGLNYVMQGFPQTSGGSGFGCGFADLDADGDPDVILLGAPDKKVGIFENNGAGFFTDRSATDGIPDLAQASGFAAADYDGDGLVDLYITQIGLPNMLARNLGNFQFEDATNDALVGDIGSGMAPSFGDFDGDGWLDLYVCNYAGLVPGTELLHNRLYRNLSTGSFEDVTVAQTVHDDGYGFQSVWFDYDLDGDVDLYLSNDRGHLDPFLPNQLWRNDGGQLVNVSESSGAGIGLFSMGVACGDFNGDRLPDLYCTNIPGDFAWGTNNPLLLNQEGGTFVEESVVAGVDNPWTSWGSIFYDFDNDGHLDLYVNNMFVPNTLYLNDGGFPCIEDAAGAGMAANTGVSFGSAIADVDGDGDIDLLCNNLGSNVELFINHEGARGNSIRYRVEGIGPNVDAIGVRIETRLGSDWKTREILAGGNGYLGQNELTVHVGTDTATAADEIVVVWPGGAPTRTLTDAPVGQTWTIHPASRLGDANDDGNVRLDDFVVFAACYGGVVAPGCEIMDFDGDFVIDAGDYTAFLAVYTGPTGDCDENGVPDLDQILADPSQDGNGDGVIDACQSACPDLNDDGVVSFADILVLLGEWGPCAACPSDLNGDGAVGFADVLVLLGAWGECG